MASIFDPRCNVNDLYVEVCNTCISKSIDKPSIYLLEDLLKNIGIFKHGVFRYHCIGRCSSLSEEFEFDEDEEDDSVSDSDIPNKDLHNNSPALSASTADSYKSTNISPLYTGTKIVNQWASTSTNAHTPQTHTGIVRPNERPIGARGINLGLLRLITEPIRQDVGPDDPSILKHENTNQDSPSFFRPGIERE